MDFIQVLAAFGVIWVLLTAAAVCWMMLFVLLTSRDYNKAAKLAGSTKNKKKG